MFAYQECLGSLKFLAKNSSRTDLTYCQRLTLCSQELGFNNYNHFKKTMPNLPEDKFGKVSLRLMRQYCQSAKPSLDMEYYEFYAERGPKIAFYSSWIGWDCDGREVRVPRPLNAQDSIDGLRELFLNPVYVVENDRELLSWLYSWHGTALVPKDLAKQYFPEKINRDYLVCEDVNLLLVQSRNDDYGDNIAT